jgi:voltage-gated potassium channel
VGIAVSEQSDGNDIAVSSGVLPGGSRERRRLIARSALRILITTLGLLVLYLFVPVPGTSGAGALAGLIAGLVVFVVLVGRQIRTILRAEHPLMRAIEVVAFAIPLLVVVFAFTYLSLSRADSASFSEHLSRIAALYYTVSTLCTVGFGDITANSDAARILVTLQMLFDIALVGGLVRLIILAARTGLRRQSAGVELRGTDADADPE